MPDRPARRRHRVRWPSDLPPGSWPATLRRTGQQFLEDNLMQWAAALTFFAVISLFPSLLMLASLLSLIGSSAIEPLVQNISQLAPATSRDIAIDALRTIEDSNRAGVGFLVGLAAALWAASAYVGAFVPAANVVWDVDEARSIWSRVVARLALTVLLLLLTAITALTVVLTGPIAEGVGRALGLGDTGLRVWQIAKWPFLIAVVMFLLAVLYWTSPNVHHPGWRWVTPGSLLAVVLWVVASLLFTLFVGNFGTFNATYGSIGGVLVFLLWLWITNIAILLGAELNAEIERTRAIEGGMRPEDKTPFLPERETASD